MRKLFTIARKVRIRSSSNRKNTEGLKLADCFQETDSVASEAGVDLAIRIHTKNQVFLLFLSCLGA